MKSKASSFNSTSDCDSLHQHLHAYALAASAAGVTMLALAQPATSEIIYSPTQVTIGPNQTYSLDLNNDGIVDFTIVNQLTSSASLFELNLFVQNSGGGNAVAGHIVNSGGFPWAYAFSSGFQITQPKRHFTSARATMAWSRGTKWASSWGGSWPGTYGFGGGGYLGLKFKIKGKIHYGWARLDTDLARSQSATLYGYAYETIPNKPIKTGQEQDNQSVKHPSTSTPTQPARKQPTLGMLARGSSAIVAWRQKQLAAEGR
jgi:hypothetical protein